MPGHYLNQCRVIVNWTLENRLQGDSNHNTNIFIHENKSEYIVCEIAAILSRERWVNMNVMNGWKDVPATNVTYQCMTGIEAGNRVDLRFFLATNRYCVVSFFCRIHCQMKYSSLYCLWLLPLTKPYDIKIYIRCWYRQESVSLHHFNMFSMFICNAYNNLS